MFRYSLMHDLPATVRSVGSLLDGAAADIASPSFLRSNYDCVLLIWEVRSLLEALITFRLIGPSNPRVLAAVRDAPVIVPASLSPLALSSLTVLFLPELFDAPVDGRIAFFDIALLSTTTISPFRLLQLKPECTNSFVNFAGVIAELERLSFSVMGRTETLPVERRRLCVLRVVEEAWLWRVGCGAASRPTCAEYLKRATRVSASASSSRKVSISEAWIAAILLVMKLSRITILSLYLGLMWNCTATVLRCSTI